ncbi:hypothetical protein [Jeotgalibacillus malaysiensis]|uniref:hypothetical protein n=1 Tax=Jeotgalibacillus malaysiensis TaxID=1508404 RepID=UPI00384ACC16
MTVYQAPGDSRIPIGIIGPQHHFQELKPVLKTFPSFIPEFKEANHIDEILKYTEELLSSSAVILFLEWQHYLEAKQHLRFNIPVHVVSPSGTGLYRAILLASHKFSPLALTVDTVEKEYVEQVLGDLSLSIESQKYISSDHLQQTNEVIKHHQLFLDENGGTVITGITEVASNMERAGYNVQLIRPTRQDFIVSLERALLSTDTRKNKETQIVFMLINIDSFRQVIHSYRSEHDIQLLKLKTQELLLDYAKQLDSHFLTIGDEYLFITTRGIFESETRGYKYIPLLHSIKKQTGFSASIGIGFGQSAADAGNHARLALKQSKDVGGNACYIVRENRSVVGPVEVSHLNDYEQYELSITDHDFLERAEQAGMSAAYMKKLMARVTRHKKTDYTAQELAQTLNITVRSAHRILLKWMDADLVRIIGEEKLTYKGRPRRIYSLTFTEDN